MHVAPHDQFDAIARRMTRVLEQRRTVPVDRLVYRAVHRVEHLTDTSRSREGGGRWNAPGSFEVLYTSTTPELAVRESLAMRRRFGLPDHEALPRIVAAVEIEASPGLDLTDGDVRQILRVSRRRLVDEPWWTLNQRGREALTQAIGRAAAEAGLGSLIVPSAAGGAEDTNIVVLPASLADRRRISPILPN